MFFNGFTENTEITVKVAEKPNIPIIIKILFKKPFRKSDKKKKILPI